MLVEDFAFHVFHRSLHHKSIYPYVHKIHHEHRITIAIATLHVHPVEFVLCNLLPAALGPHILGDKIHCVTVIGLYLLLTVESIDGHCGYEFSWSPYKAIPFTVD